MEIGLILLEDVYLIEPKYTYFNLQSNKNENKITAKSREREPGGRKPCCAEANNNAPSLAYRHMIGRISYLRSVASAFSHISNKAKKLWWFLVCHWSAEDGDQHHKPHCVVIEWREGFYNRRKQEEVQTNL
ncbi:hypothetical protein GQX74_015694 [Glossina fuscipes]|nr:hypothetical protein GQX74_015694 [Glossina fuscipes]